MEFRITHLVLTAVIATGCMQSASAQEGRPGARFNFAPNVWKVEQARIPRDSQAEPAHKVRSGAVPQGNMLGLDPEMLAKPAPPPAPVQVPQVAARPTTTNVTPKMFVPNTSFNPAFGKPTSPMVAQMPAVVPQQAVARPMAPVNRPVASVPAHAATPVRHHARTHVAGKLMKPARTPAVVPAQASPSVASYGKNVGYVPGPFLPTSSGTSAQADVYGRLMKKHK